MKSLRKNDDYRVEIKEHGKNGEGIAYIEGNKVFVNNAIVGDQVEIKIIKVSKNYSVGKIVNIISRSSDYETPKCPYVQQCGGCQIQSIKYQKQLDMKRDIVDRILNTENKLSVEVLPTIGMENPYYYRNKSSIPFSKSKDKINMGFYRKNSHSIVEIDNCIIQNNKINEIMKIFYKFVKDNNIEIYNETEHTGLLKQLVVRSSRVDEKFMLIIVANSDNFVNSEELIEKLKKIEGFASLILNINKDKTNRIMGYSNKVLYGEGTLIDRILDIQFEISPNSFFQINPEQTDKLYKKVLEFAEIKESDIVYDLYCGIGSITAFLARKAKKVYGIEVVEAAVENARKNMELNNINNTEFFAGKVENLIENLTAQKEKADIVVVDPPRKGCEESVLKVVADQKPEKIIYVSCLPESLGRDLKYLVSRGYKIEKVQAVDMFCHSVHVETIVALYKKD